MTEQPITSNQRKQLRRIVEDGIDAVRLDKESAQRVIMKGGEFQSSLKEYVRRISDASGYYMSRSILGVDFITPEQVMEARRSVVYSNDQIKVLAESLPSEEVLWWYRLNGYALMPAPPNAMSTIDVRDIQPSHFHLEVDSFGDEFARNDKTSFGWIGVKKTPIFNSRHKKWGDQYLLLSLLERVPNIAEMCWFITTYFEVRGLKLFKRDCVRTCTSHEKGFHIVVGHFNSDKFTVSCLFDGSRIDDLGLSGARGPKF